MAGILSVVKLPQLNALKTEALSTEYLLSPALEKYCLLMAVVLAVVHCSNSLAELDIGVLAVAAIPVNAECESIGEVDVPVNFGGVTFLPEDHLYADSTGVILSPEPLDLD